MLRQMYIILNEEIIYKRNFGKAIESENFGTILSTLLNDAFSNATKEVVSYDYFKHKISFISEKDLNLILILVTNIGDDSLRIQSELYRLKKDFLHLFGDSISTGLDTSILDIIDPMVDLCHRNLRPKISLVGFSGVGKTTITRLIKAEEIPSEHIPTISGDVTTIKIGKLHFHLWDFAGQEQFSFLWNKFIKGSDAVLIITDSSIENVEKSKFFMEIIKEEAPYAQVAVIGNKQDISGSLNIEAIEGYMGLKAYSMIAIESGNRIKMIQIIADILEMSTEVSPLLQPLFERDELMVEAQDALEKGELKKAASLLLNISDICIGMGDDSLGAEFFNKAEQLKSYLLEIPSE